MKGKKRLIEKNEESRWTNEAKDEEGNEDVDIWILISSPSIIRFG